MIEELGLYAELLIFLVGTLLYGFLTREILRNPAIHVGNRAFLALTTSLAIWYAGSLADEVGTVLLGPSRWLPIMGPWVDVARGLAFLFSFPLLAHALWWMLGGRVTDGYRRERPGWYWLIPGYITFLLFLPTAYRVLDERTTLLADVSRDVYPLFLVHAILCSVVSARFIVSALKAPVGSELVHFLRWLMGSFLAMVGLVVMGAFVIHVGSGSNWAEPLWRLSAEAAGLILGVTFLYFIQRYNLFRMSISFRSLRHFAAIMALVALVMLAGPALPSGHGDFARRFIAWGVLIALVGALVYTPVMERLLRRFDGLRRLLGRALTEEEIDRLTERIHDPRLTQDQMMELVAGELSRLLVADVRFVTDRSAEAILLPIWRHFSEPKQTAFNRLDAPTSDTARALTESGLHAVFPLRVGEELTAILTVGASTTGGGYQEGEMEAIRLALRQLATSLELGRLMEARLADERRRAEQERLGMLGLISASLAHELKNPLSSMKALAQTVREELVSENPSGEQGRDLGLIVEQIDHLNGVAKEILEFSRPKEGADVELVSLVRSSSYVLDHEARRRGVVLDGSGVHDVGRVPGTKATWQTVVFNLILNAVHHAPAGSTAEVRLARKDDRILFETVNAGPPIAPEVVSRLFDAFVTDEAVEGTGLGLSLVAQKVGELGGTVELVNEPDHIVFRVCLDMSAVKGEI